MMHRCHFFCDVSGEKEPIVITTPMVPPQIGSMLFLEGEECCYRVIDVQYQLRRIDGPEADVVTMVIVMLTRLSDRSSL